MAKITTLRTARGRQRLNVFLDGKFAFSLEAELVAKEDLQAGQEISGSQVEALARSDKFYRCFNAALRLLSYRPRSESELRERLLRCSFDGDCIEAVVAKLKEQGLIDDSAFAQFWKDNRESFSPRSQRLTRLELRRKGVAAGIIDHLLDKTSDADNAYRAALSKTRSLPMSDYQSFQRRLGDYLKRRGFAYEVINLTIERIWQEKGSDSK